MLNAEIDPAEAGFDPQRLARIDTHFARYVDEGKLPGYLAVIARDGKVVHVAKAGQADIEAGRAVADDTLWRIYSMTKPITSVALMLLWEAGAFELKDPIETYLPAFKDARVWAGGNQNKPITRPAVEPIRIWHLLTHTAGLTYGFHYAHPLDGVYRDHGYEFGSRASLADTVDAFGQLPLLFEPGTEFNYSVATDVLGRLIEVLSGQSLDVFLQERIFAPLGMTDTAFSAVDPDRMAALYQPGLKRDDRMGQVALHTPAMLSGGGGLVGTAADYHRFTSMLVAGGAPLLAPRTLRLMARNHLPGGAELKDIARPTISETQNDGMGFGLGFSVVLDPAATKLASPAGELAWGGLASTAFFVSPQDRLSVQFFTQMIPSSAYPLRSQLRQLVYQAMTD
ncbi:beta-lactamase family protein [Solirubrobacter phytolaccae]|uniref:Beta-lactamase family protein n=1 Tax=Solirubrobacter phytolaccae TaxID=1404360 RepID=A0A9X3NCT6_9ACTN|nr:serine hydrolase domain-containing protein [Solirubrobacter phytolaccae]MDA0183721.1 beta-lactamase family protein [Solirubrobacter phytolaccae]